MIEPQLDITLTYLGWLLATTSAEFMPHRAMGSNRQRKPGCENCRARHVKCEGGFPCSQCLKRGVGCNKPPRTRFRRASIFGNSQPEFPHSQVWCKTAGRPIDFVDQTLETTRHYNEEAESDKSENFIDADVDPASVGSAAAGATQVAGGSVSPLDESTGGSGTNVALGPTQWDSEMHSLTGKYHFDVGNSYLATAINEFPATNRPFLNFSTSLPRDGQETRNPECIRWGDISLKGSSPSFEDRRLLRGFVDTIGTTLNLCDPYKTLAVWIFEISLRCSEVMQLVLALAKLQFNEVSVVPNNPSLGHLDESAVAAATLLLRLASNIQGTHSDPAAISYVWNLWETISSNEGAGIQDNPIMNQVGWAVLRQEIFLAITNQEPVCINHDRGTLRLPQHISEDETWINRILLHLAETVKFCFGDSRSPAVYDQLVSNSAAWEKSKPESFAPLFFTQPSEGSVFPEIWFLNSFAAVSSQYFHLVRILLLAYNPRTPRLGRAKRAATRWRDKEMRSDVKIVCGIAEAKTETNPMHLPACMAIAAAGDKFTSQKEQDVLFNILTKTSHRYGWSTLAA